MIWKVSAILMMGSMTVIIVLNCFRSPMMAQSLRIASSIIALQILSFGPALACDPYLYSGDFEEMLKEGESWEIVLDSMKNSIGYTGKSCFYEFKRYVKKNKTEFPKLHSMMTN